MHRHENGHSWGLANHRELLLPDQAVLELQSFLDKAADSGLSDMLNALLLEHRESSEKIFEEKYTKHLPGN